MTESYSLTEARSLKYLALLGLVVYGLYVAMHLHAAASGSDQSGYLNHAKALASGHVHVSPRLLPGLAPKETPPYLYSPLGFKPVEGRPDLMVPTYPPGLSLFVLAAQFLVGWDHAADCVVLLHCLAGVILAYALGRTCGLGVRWSLAAATAVGASPLYLAFSQQAMTDMPALVWTTAALVCALRSGAQPKFALAAGACFAVSVLIRPNCALTAVGLSVLLGLSPGRWVGFGLGGLPGAVFSLVHATYAYSGPFLTGYGDARGMFTLSVVPETLSHYVRWLPVCFTPVIWFFPLVIAPGVMAGRSAWGLFIVGISYLGFYAAYIITHEDWWCLRFLLPIGPALIVGGFGVFQALGQRLRRRLKRSHAVALPLQITGAVVGLGLIGLLEAREAEALKVMTTGKGEQTYELVGDWAREHLPDHSALVTMQYSGAMYYYTPFVILRYDQLNPANSGPILAAAEKEGVPLYAIVFRWEEQEAIHQRLPYDWKLVHQIRDADIWRYVSARHE